MDRIFERLPSSDVRALWRVSIERSATRGRIRGPSAISSRKRSRPDLGFRVWAIQDLNL
jgi:hypothetical protein